MPDYQDLNLHLLQGNCLDRLKDLPENSVDVCCTSPPYWALRNYGTVPQIWPGKKPMCSEHKWSKAPPRRFRSEGDVVNEKSIQAGSQGTQHNLPETDFCAGCGAWQGELGLEPTPELYIDHLVQIFREVRRVLKPTGTLWLNLSDSYAAGVVGREPSYGTSDKGRAGWTDRDCPSFRLCDACGDALGLRSPHSDSLLASSQQPSPILTNPERTGSSSVHRATSHSSDPDSQQISATLHQGPKNEPSVLLPPDEKASTINGSSRQRPEGSHQSDSSSSNPSSPDSSGSGVSSSEHTLDGQAQTHERMGDTVSPFEERMLRTPNIDGNCSRCEPYSTTAYRAKPKDLVGIPWMAALALRNDGWYLRADIILAKRNCMPESIRDRPTRSHEYLFLLSKERIYYYDEYAIREPLSDSMIKQIEKGAREVKLDNQWKHDEESRFGKTSGNRAFQDQGSLERISHGRNKRDVWWVTTSSYKEAHFAVYSESWVEPMVKAGSSEKGCCAKCGAPWERIFERKFYGRWDDGEGNNDDQTKPKYADPEVTKDYKENYVPPKALGWKASCECGTPDLQPSVVLDPFLGSGTTALVALKHGRKAVGIDLQDEYFPMIHRRLAEFKGLVRLE